MRKNAMLTGDQGNNVVFAEHRVHFGQHSHKSLINNSLKAQMTSIPGLLRLINATYAHPPRMGPQIDRIP